MVKRLHRSISQSQRIGSSCHISVSLPAQSGGASGIRFCSNGPLATTVDGTHGSVVQSGIAGGELRFSISMASLPAGTATSLHILASGRLPGNVHWTGHSPSASGSVAPPICTIRSHRDLDGCTRRRIWSFAGSMTMPTRIHGLAGFDGGRGLLGLRLSSVGSRAGCMFDALPRNSLFRRFEAGDSS
jgi:hypothetical protein